MKILYFIFIISLLVMGLIFKKKDIKDIKFYNFSIFYILVILYISIIIIVEFIVPIPTYYIKHKEIESIETIIEREMTSSNILHDIDSLKVVNQFIGKYNQLYLSTYQVNGEEEARMFDFKVNIFGNLKPSHDFSESEIVLKEELDDGSNYRIIRDGIPAFYIRYGYANNPEQFKNRVVGKFVVRSINPEGYYMLVTRNDDWSPFGWELLIWGIVLLIILIKEKKKLSYSETNFLGKIPFEIEYYV